MLVLCCSLEHSYGSLCDEEISRVAHALKHLSLASPLSELTAHLLDVRLAVHLFLLLLKLVEGADQSKEFEGEGALCLCNLLALDSLTAI